MSPLAGSGRNTFFSFSLHLFSYLLLSYIRDNCRLLAVDVSLLSCWAAAAVFSYLDVVEEVGRLLKNPGAGIRTRVPKRLCSEALTTALPSSDSSSC